MKNWKGWQKWLLSLGAGVGCGAVIAALVTAPVVVPIGVGVLTTLAIRYAVANVTSDFWSTPPDEL